MSYSEALAAELKWQLKSQNISASSLASMLQIGPRTLTQWLNGRNKIPFGFVYSTSLVMGARTRSLFRLAEERMNSENPLLMTGNPERREPTDLSAEQIQWRSNRFIDCVAAELRTQLAEREISVRQISLKLGKAPTIAGEWLHGKKVLPVHFAYNICQAINFPIDELVERAEERIDLYPEDADEVQPATDGPQDDSTPPIPIPIPPQEISRRLRALLELKGLTEDQGYSLVVASAKRANVSLGREHWAAALDGSTIPDRRLLSIVAESLDTPLDYLTVAGDEVTARVEAEAKLARVAAEAGITNLAARGQHLTPESLLEIANLVDRFIPKQ